MSALIQQTPEWLALRKDKIGASDAPIIMGVSPWTTPYQLWLEKTSISEAKEANWAQKQGLRKEEAARQALEKLTGLSLSPKVIFGEGDKSWMMASLDAITFYGTAAFEIKCPGWEDHFTALLGEIPEKYYPQLQQQIELTKLDSVGYYSYFENEDDSYSEVLLDCVRDDKYINTMLKKGKAFWDCVQDLIPPAMTDKDYRVKNDDLWNHVAQKWHPVYNKRKELELQLKEVEEEEKKIKDELISLANNKNSMGAGVKLCRIIRKGNVEYAKIPELETVNLEAYRKDPIETWRLTEM